MLQPSHPVDSWNIQPKHRHDKLQYQVVYKTTLLSLHVSHIDAQARWPAEDREARLRTNQHERLPKSKLPNGVSALWGNNWHRHLSTCPNNHHTHTLITNSIHIDYYKTFHSNAYTMVSSAPSSSSLALHYFVQPLVLKRLQHSYTWHTEV